MMGSKIHYILGYGHDNRKCLVPDFVSDNSDGTVASAEIVNCQMEQNGPYY